MSRCTKTSNLEVHHKRIDGGNGLDNAQVLCQPCHVNTSTYGSTTHVSPPDFSQTIKDAALRRAGNRCECQKLNCH
jgi:5-methylcytosine-specific restriction endonuclease McrA